jgi:hypothetical protein
VRKDYGVGDRIGVLLNNEYMTVSFLKNDELMEKSREVEERGWKRMEEEEREEREDGRREEGERG